MAFSFEAVHKLAYFTWPHGEKTCPIILCLCPVVQALLILQGSSVSDPWRILGVHECSLGVNESSNLDCRSWHMSGGKEPLAMFILYTTWKVAPVFRAHAQQGVWTYRHQPLHR